ncbi:hypothetical protein Tsubulata_009269 [Turnera subulata]|uniref:Uncharacterized protein n=1 Tax=Turnera subulata TaxID=218843 RepID=A0A9Q0FZH4_9ROSI|nr:hypothetical protein Tsubulata_009269 [Turnera subulata]
MSVSMTPCSFVVTTKPSLPLFSFSVPSKTVKDPALSPSSLFCPHKKTPRSGSFNSNFRVSAVATPEVEKQVEEEKEEMVGDYTMTQIADKAIDVFMNVKPRVKEWRKSLVYREDWNKCRERFYSRCQSRADAETDPIMKERLMTLASKVKRIDSEMEKHHELLTEIQGSPTDLNAIVTRRRKDFTGEFFRYLNLVSETYDDTMESRDGNYFCTYMWITLMDSISRLGARCLSAVSAFDNTLEYVETLDTAQAKFDDILDSPSVDVACEKIKSLAKAKELDSSLILLINSAWEAAKESKTMKNEVKEIMYQLYKATKSSLRSIAPKELKLLKHLLNIKDPEERFSALAKVFSPGDEYEAKDPNALHTTPKELHKWITIMLDAYHFNMEVTDIKEAKKMSQPIVMQRLLILKETIEQDYMDKSTSQTPPKEEDNLL